MALKLYSFPSFYIFHIHKLCKSYEKLRIFKAILEVLKAELVKMTVLRKLLIKLNGSDPLSEIPVGWPHPAVILNFMDADEQVISRNTTASKCDITWK